MFWNEYKSKIQRVLSRDAAQNNYTRRILLDASYSGVNRLFVAGFDARNNGIQRNDQRKYFLPRINIKDYNVMTDGRNFYDQNINDTIKMYNEIRKTALGKGNDYTVGRLLDYQYFKEHYKLLCCNLSMQSILDSDPKAVQQIEFLYRLENNKVT